MKKWLERFATLTALLCALCLLGGCAAAPAESIGEPSAESDSASVPVQTGAEESAVPQTESSAGQPPENEQEDTQETPPAQESVLASVEKAEARIAQEQAEYAALFTPENTFVSDGFQLAVSRYGYLYARRDAQSYIECYYSAAVYEAEEVTIHRMQAQGHYAPKEFTGWILVEKGGAYVDAFPFDGTHLMAENWDENDPEYENAAGVKEACQRWDPVAQTLTEFYNKTDLLIVTDLAKREVRWGYEIQPENIRSVLKSSKDGAWDICLAGRTGGGDAWGDLVVLRENATGKLRQIGLFYDYSSDYGFFRNGDLYVCEPENLLILTAESGYTEAAPFAMEFGNQPDGTKRILHALHRDPGGSGYVVLYSQQTEAEADAEWDSPQDAVIFYRMALCDTQGSLQQSWDSGYKRGKAMYDHAPVDMTRQGDTMFIRFPAVKGWTPPDFTFSLADHTFAVLETGENDG